jgi:hypothetical protein
MITGGHVYKQGVNTSNKDWYLVKEYKANIGGCKHFIPITFEDILSDMVDSPDEEQWIYLVIKEPENKTEYNFRFNSNYNDKNDKNCNIYYGWLDKKNLYADYLSDNNKNLLSDNNKDIDKGYRKFYNYDYGWPNRITEKISEIENNRQTKKNRENNQIYYNNNSSDVYSSRGTTGDAAASFISLLTNGGADNQVRDPRMRDSRMVENHVSVAVEIRAHEIEFFNENRFYGHDPAIVINPPNSIYVIDQRHDNNATYKWNGNNNFESLQLPYIDRRESHKDLENKYFNPESEWEKHKNEWQKYFIEMKEEFKNYLKKYEIGIDNMNKTIWKDVGKDPEKDPERKSFLNSIWKSLRRSKNLEPTTNQSTTSKGGKKLKKSRKPVKKQRKTRKNKILF